jgi:hypothetical protein
MGVKEGVDFKDPEVLQQIYTGAMKVFGQGILVPSDVHICGWDWIDFNSIDEDENILEYKFDIRDISNGIYDRHNFSGLTLKEILIKTEGRFLFNINCDVNWEEGQWI